MAREPMTDQRFNALISLLDDTDPQVSEQVESELFRMGHPAIPRLEQAWEVQTDTTVQQRLEELIFKIQVTHYTHELFEWRMEGGRDLLDGWITLTQIQFPTLNVQKYRNEINRLVNKIWLMTNPGMNDIEKLCVVNKFLYHNEHFAGNYKDPDRAENNYFSFLMDGKKGNSLSLAALYYIICQQLEIQLQVVNFMGYYALRYYQYNSHFYIDAYNKGMFFTPQQVQQFLKKLKAEENVFTYKPMSNIYLVLQLIGALSASYEQAGQDDKAQLFEQLLKDIEVNFENGSNILGLEDENQQG